ncbi:Wadjet anti-phage system protein JetD domain-containing protein [Actinokineospora soli]|uniref:Wadjet anti-phage system protein JetD domain-containing protein n=1 Tax=Actinokineospora soli TaxID=1048753 RepID=A0ABW2TTW7_9PSEU
MDDWPNRRVSLRDLWRVLDETDPSSGARAGRRQLLADVLNELAAADQLELPSTRSYDRTERPALPTFVTLPGDAEPQRRFPDPVWHPKLAWAAGARLTAGQRELLGKINEWLFRSRDDLVVPLRERSLEIMGDEKALDGKFATALFGEGRLSLDLLRAHRTALPLYAERVGDGPVLLVVENSATFHTMVSVLGDNPSRVGWIGWGAGAGFETSVHSIPALGPPLVREIRYFGDLDRNGLRIPASASRIAELSGLPPVLPASPLYRILLEIGVPQPGQPKIPVAAATALVDWLDPAHADEARDLLTNGFRLAQEAVGTRYLRTDASAARCLAL